MSQPAFETLLYDVQDGVATITLNRPDKLNAFNTLMRDEIITALDHTDADDAVRVVIFTGAGRGYCAGADLSSGGNTFDYADRKDSARDKYKVGDVYRDGGGLVTLRIFKSLKPVIGAINGPAVGIGVTMQLPMDIRLASTQARFGFVFSRRGIVPEAASTWFLSRVVGIQTALEWCYTGRVFDAQEAHRERLVRSLHEPQDLLPAARALAREIADNAAPVAIALTRQMLWRCTGDPTPFPTLDVDGAYAKALGAGPDVREGVAAFLEKRPPAFPGRVSSDMPDGYPWWDEA